MFHSCFHGRSGASFFIFFLNSWFCRSFVAVGDYRKRWGLGVWCGSALVLFQTSSSTRKYPEVTFFYICSFEYITGVLLVCSAVMVKGSTHNTGSEDPKQLLGCAGRWGRRDVSVCLKLKQVHLDQSWWIVLLLTEAWALRGSSSNGKGSVALHPFL